MLLFVFWSAIRSHTYTNVRRDAGRNNRINRSTNYNPRRARFPKDWVGGDSSKFTFQFPRTRPAAAAQPSGNPVKWDPMLTDVNKVLINCYISTDPCANRSSVACEQGRTHLEREFRSAERCWLTGRMVGCLVWKLPFTTGYRLPACQSLNSHWSYPRVVWVLGSRWIDTELDSSHYRECTVCRIIMEMNLIIKFVRPLPQSEAKEKKKY